MLFQASMNFYILQSNLCVRFGKGKNVFICGDGLAKQILKMRLYRQSLYTSVPISSNPLKIMKTPKSFVILDTKGPHCPAHSKWVRFK